MIIPNVTLAVRLDPVVQSPGATDRNLVLGVAGPMEHLNLVNGQDSYLGQALTEILRLQNELLRLPVGPESEKERAQKMAQIAAIQDRLQPHLDDHYSEEAVLEQARQAHGAPA